MMTTKTLLSILFFRTVCVLALLWCVVVLVGVAAGWWT